MPRRHMFGQDTPGWMATGIRPDRAGPGNPDTGPTARTREPIGWPPVTMAAAGTAATGADIKSGPNLHGRPKLVRYTRILRGGSDGLRVDPGTETRPHE